MAFSTIAASFAAVAFGAEVAGLAGASELAGAPELAGGVGFEEAAGFVELAPTDVVAGVDADFFAEPQPASSRVRAVAQLRIERAGVR